MLLSCCLGLKSTLVFGRLVSRGVDSTNDRGIWRDQTLIAREGFLAGGTASLSGTFDVLLLGSFSPLAGDTFEILTADIDGDGNVDADDLSDSVYGWQARFGVDRSGGDFLAWQQQFGSGVPAIASLQEMPEPAGVVLVLAGTLAIGLGWRGFC